MLFFPYLDYKIPWIQKPGLKTLTLRYKKDNVYLTTGKNVTNKRILAFLDNYQDLIIKHYELIKAHQKPQIHYFGKCYELLFKQSSTNQVIVLDDFILVYARSLSEKHLKKVLKEFYIKEIEKSFLTFKDECLDRALEIGIDIKDLEFLFLYRDRTLGYCNKRRQIMLSGKLVKYPLDYQKYVFYHELAHLVYFDHSPSFHQLLNVLSPGYKDLIKRYKNAEYLFDYI